LIYTIFADRTLKARQYEEVFTNKPTQPGLYIVRGKLVVMK
jgi:hypothetical protein